MGLLLIRLNIELLELTTINTILAVLHAGNIICKPKLNQIAIINGNEL